MLARKPLIAAGHHQRAGGVAQICSQSCDNWSQFIPTQLIMCFPDQTAKYNLISNVVTALSLQVSNRHSSTVRHISLAIDNTWKCPRPSSLSSRMQHCTHAWPKKQTVAPLSKKIKTAAPKDRRRPLSLSRDMINR